VKERLTGAIILVAALVLLVPELLTGPSSKQGAKPAGEDSASMRSYTIDLADDSAAGRSSSAGPTSGPTAVTEEPVATAKVEEGDESDAGSAAESAPGNEGVASLGAAGDGAVESRSESDAAEETPSVAGRTGSQSAETARSASGPTAAGSKPAGDGKPGSDASVEPERPRSAFGPNAERPASPSVAPRSSSAGNVAGAASSGAASRREATAANSSASAARETSGSNTPAGRKGAETVPAPTRTASADAKSSKGWAVQLGVFEKRENAERLAKQVKGKGYPVIVNETSGTKHLYRVRVGPEKDRASADALNARLRAAGHSGAVVAIP